VKEMKKKNSMLVLVLLGFILILADTPRVWADDYDSQNELTDQFVEPNEFDSQDWNADGLVGTEDGVFGSEPSGSVESINPLGIEPLSFSAQVATIASALDSSKKMVFDIEWASQANGANAIIYTDHTGPNQRFRFIQDTDGFYSIVSIYSGRALDIYDNRVADGTPIIQFNDHGGLNQRWSLVPQSDGSYVIVSKLNNQFCLDIKGGRATNSSIIVLSRIKNDSLSQRFYINTISPSASNGTYTISPLNALNRVLDIKGATQNNAETAILFSPNGGLNQCLTFTFQPENGYYYITLGHSAMVLDVYNLGKTPGTAVIQYPKNGGYNQLWDLRKEADGNYSIRSACNGLALDVYGERTDNLAPLIVWTFHGRPNQRWKFSPTSFYANGTMAIALMNGTRLEVPGNQNSDGTQTRINTAANVLNQRFYIIHQGNDIYTLESMSSGRRLGVSSASSANVGIYLPNNSTTQQWRMIPAGGNSFYLENIASGKCLSTNGGSISAGTASVVAARANTTSQKWLFAYMQPMPSGSFVFLSAIASDRALDNPGQAMQPDVDLTIWAINRGPAQRFNVMPAPNNSFRIVNMGSGLTVQVRGSTISGTNGSARVVQDFGNGLSANQQWFFEYAGNGYFRIVNALSGKRACLTVDGGNTALGARVGLLDISSSNTGQLFKPESQGNTTYYSMNMAVDAFSSIQGVNLSGYYNTAGQAINPVNPNHNTDRMAQFQDLRRSTGVTADQLNAFIDSAADGRSGLLHGKGAVIIAACAQFGINETYFLAHTILESGWGKWVLGDGPNQGFTYDGKTQIQDRDGVYKYFPAGTYYNFFGIGAYDASPLSGGRAMAIQQGWNSVDKALYGAAEWIAENYIYGYDLNGNSGGIRYNNYPQPTLYAMKWDYGRTNDTGAKGWHQYATDAGWARKIATLMESCYSFNNARPEFYYIIPVF